MTARAIIGGVERHLGAWRPSPRKLQGIKPTFDVDSLPMQIATMPTFPKDYNQLSIGACGPNSVGETLEYQLSTKLSRLFLYFFTRTAENDLFEDGGVVISDMLGALHTMGMPLEELCPYDPALFQAAPSIQALYDASQRRVARYDVVVDLDHILFELNRKQPVIFGFGVPRSMQSDETARTGLVAVPSASDPVMGGHCVVAISADRERELVQCTSHWGEDYGDDGTIWLGYEHFRSGNASDFSAIRAPGFVGP